MKPISITGTACKEAIRNAVCLNFIFHYIISLLRNALPVNKIGARLPFTITNNKHKFHNSALEAMGDYTNMDEYGDIDEDDALEWLNDRTFVLECDNGHIVIQNF